MNKNKHHILFCLLLAAIAAMVLYSCASIGNPSGGPQDRMPPIFVGSKPMPNELNFHGNKVELLFDEIVKLDDPSTKIIVSPAQTEMPKITANGRKVTVELIDTLLPNTTYTVDFSNSIQDNNEGNPLGNFAFAFSTGPSIDTLRVSGYVLDSHTLEPMKGVIVGLLDASAPDSAFYTTKLQRISRANDLGQFVIRNVKPGRYRIFALNDLDRDYKFANPTEDIAFVDSVIVPSATTVDGVDTIYNASNKIDTIIPAKHTVYHPDNLLLNMFNENRKAQYLVGNTRIDSTRISLIFAAPSDTLPHLQLLDKPDAPADWYTLERSVGNDSLTYWIKPKQLVSSDTLRVAVQSLRTDTLNNIVWGTDTLNFTFRRIKIKKKKDKEKTDSVPPIPLLNLRLASGSTQEVYAPLLLESDHPIARLDTAAIRLEQKQDSLWNPVKDYRLALRDSALNRRTIAIHHRWDPGATYRLSVDSIGITDIYGLYNGSFSTEVRVRKMEDYGNIIFSIPAVRDSAFVELLNSSDKPVMIVPVHNNRAEFINLLPSKYYARLVLDRNNNRKYDTGNYALRLQPEETFYYPAAINLKKNWDIEQTWDIYALPVDKQKPYAIKKNKPERSKEEELRRQRENAENGEEEDESGFNNFDSPNDPNYRRYNQDTDNGYGTENSEYRNVF